MTKSTVERIEADLARIYRAESASLIARFATRFRDIELAEDSVQDAFIEARASWIDSGLPANPRAWLTQVAHRKAIDHYRKRQVREQSESQQLALDSLTPKTSDEERQSIPDEQLKLMFVCCHPSLAQTAQVALTLKLLCGLNSREIGRAFLSSEVTINQRLVRAKQKIKKTGIKFEVPGEDRLGERLDSVLQAIYLIYNESYSAFEGQTLTRDDLAYESIRLARLVNEVLDHSEAKGLLALLLLHQGRRPARLNAQNEMVSLEMQDRSLWNTELIERGTDLLREALQNSPLGPFQLQAAISAVHCGAESWEMTNWSEVLMLYKKLFELQPSPVVQLNLLPALAHSGKVKQAYSGLLKLESKLMNYQPFYAAKGLMQRELAMHDLAKVSYEKAIALSNNKIEKAFLIKVAKMST